MKMPPLNAGDPEAILPELGRRLRTRCIIPYLGPGLAELSNPDVPMTPEALATFFAGKVALPRRAKGNVWAAAQYIETSRHRSVLTRLMAQAFASPSEPTPLHRHLAALSLPVIVDTWYDGATCAALAKYEGWGEIQGVPRAGTGKDHWYRFYDAGGREVDWVAAQNWTTVLYKPHGAVTPARNFLISDADYVEVLTEIDIQTPIPLAVKERRTGSSFLFIGCRFNDQLLRTFARQLLKRSGRVHYAILDLNSMTRNERKFLAEQNIVPLAIALPRAIEILLCH
ncbi:SIR2 family NAD-dependent protein deacylase [Bradyrhizobium sp. STM 3562]|uniref:SIR2 family NAD-dependent protein deacylase n=1 Tax=Bradyrhizobium sp. STM 3562 TaxID=578924 RepID=UPI00388D4850